MKLEVNVRIIGKICVYLLSFIFIFPFLIVIGWHVRGYYEKQKNFETISSPLRSDIEKTDGGVVVVG